MVPAGGWEIGQVNVGGVYFNGSGPANSVNVFFYFDNATFPGAPVPGGTFTAIPVTTDTAGTFTIVLPSSVTLAPGTYWVSVQANMDFGVGGQWGWNDRTIQSNSGAAFQNPGGGFACPGGNSWVRKPTCVTNAAPDNIFQLLTPGAITCPTCPPYTTTTSTGNAIVPGTTDLGNHCDDCATPITLPFPITVFGSTFTSVQASSNGAINLTGASAAFGSACPLPDARFQAAIFPFQTDLRTDNNTLTGEGIFTAVTGTAPNRTFIIEWRAEYFSGGAPANFEVVFHEGSACFDVVYGATGDTGASASAGVQQSGTGPATQFSCNQPTLTNGLKVTYCPNNCPAPIPTSAVSRKVHGASGTYDINLPLVPLNGAVGIEDRTQGAPGPVTLWYNGDFDGVNGLANERGTTVAQASVYDNFAVTAATGWNIESVFSNNLMNTNVTGASWEIRSGITAGNGGTLVASGSTLTPVVTPTGRSGFGFTEFQVKVTGLNVHLPALPAGQFYWLNVTPMGDGTGRSFDSSTGGMNAIGTPPGNDQNAFFDSTDFAAVFLPTGDPSVGQPFDFSMGVIGTDGGGGGGFNHQIVVTFPNAVTVGSATVTAGTGSVSGFTVNGNEVTINLTGVLNGQRLGVTLGDVCDGSIVGDVFIPMGVLSGDANGNGSVNGTDVGLVKSNSGQTTTASNFRTDVNASGSISATDVSATKAASGSSLP